MAAGKGRNGKSAALNYFFCLGLKAEALASSVTRVVGTTEVTENIPYQKGGESLSLP